MFSLYEKLYWTEQKRTDSWHGLSSFVSCSCKTEGWPAGGATLKRMKRFETESFQHSYFILIHWFIKPQCLHHYFRIGWIQKRQYFYLVVCGHFLVPCILAPYNIHQFTSNLNLFVRNVRSTFIIRHMNMCLVPTPQDSIGCSMKDFFINRTSWPVMIYDFSWKAFSNCVR